MDDARQPIGSVTPWQCLWVESQAVPGVGTPRPLSCADLAGVSRNSRYRYHPLVMETLHQCQQQLPVATAHARGSSDPLKSEIAGLRDRLRKLVTPADRYYGCGL